MEKLELSPCAENEEHLARHTDTSSLVAGSKVLEGVTRADIAAISKKFDEAYQALIEKEGNPGRQVFALTTDRPIGTDAVVPLETLDKSRVFEIVREPGTRGEAKIKVALISKKDMPKTNVIHAVYGPYGPTGKGGIYTMMFGDPGEPFARDLPEDAPEAQKKANEKSKKYWDEHVFLITPEELEYAMAKMREQGLPTKQAETALKFFDVRAKLEKRDPSCRLSPINKPSHSKVSEEAQNIGSIVLSSSNDGNVLGK